MTPDHSAAAVTCIGCHQPANITLRGYCKSCWLPPPALLTKKPKDN